MGIRFPKVSTSALALALAAITQPGFAQSSDAERIQTDGSAQEATQGVEEIVVTARKRSEDVQKVPLSVSAIGGIALERRGITNVRELSFTVPSLSLVGQNSARTAILQIRGIGSSGANPGIEPDVGVYFDGAYQKQAGTVLQTNFLDIEAVEILRGPQGTLYGRNTPVGAVIVRSKAPSAEPEGMTQIGAGNYGTVYAQGYVGGGIAENLNARLSFYNSRRNGYDYNISSRSSVNGADQYGGRLRLQWKPTSTFTGDLILFYNHLRDDCCVADNVDPTGPRGIATPAFLAAAQAATGRPYTNLTALDHVVDTAEDPIEFVKTFGAQFNGQVNFDNGLTLNSITAYSGTRMNTVRGASVMQPVVSVRTGSKAPIDTFSQEFRLSTPADRAISAQGGVYLFYEDTKFNERRETVQANRVFADGTTLPPGLTDDFAFGQKTYSASAYAQATWTVVDSLRLTGGLRYSHDTKHGSSQSIATPGYPNFSASFPTYNIQNLRFKESKITWMASAQYDIAPSVMLYATYSTGWKSGGFNGRLAPVNAPLIFDAESTENYELGLKSTFWNRRLLANISLYQLNVDGFQDSILNPVTGSGFIVGNAGDIRAKGVEADIQARPIPQLLLSGTLAYLSSEFHNYAAAPCYTGAVVNGSKPGTCNLNGRRPAFSPQWRWSLSAEFTQPISDSGISVFARGDVAYTGEQYTYAALDPLSFQDGYAVTNARVGVEADDQKWRVSLWAKNLTNEAYYVQVAPVANGAFVSAGGRAGVTSLIGWTGQPRTFGIEGSIKF